MAANLSWSVPFTKAFPPYNYDMTKGKVQYTWFEGGTLKPGRVIRLHFSTSVTTLMMLTVRTPISRFW